MKKETKRVMILGLIIGLCILAMPATAYVMNNTACPTDLNSCTANEVQTRQLNAVIESPGMVCEADGNFTVNITAEFSANTNRYDLGLYVAGNGGTISGKTPDAAQCQGGYGKIPRFGMQITVISVAM